MTNNITLYGINNSCSLAVHITLELLNLDYNYLTYKENINELAKLNPLKQVPTLIYNNNTLTETISILIFLADSHKESSLFPSDDLFLRAKGTEFLCYLSTTVYSQFIRYFRPDKITNNVSLLQEIKDKAALDILDSMYTINSIYKDRKYFLEDKLTLCDIYLMVFLNWGKSISNNYVEHKQIKLFYENMLKNNSIKKTFSHENIAI